MPTTLLNEFLLLCFPQLPGSLAAGIWHSPRYLPQVSYVCLSFMRLAAGHHGMMIWTSSGLYCTIAWLLRRCRDAPPPVRWWPVRWGWWVAPFFVGGLCPLRPPRLLLGVCAPFARFSVRPAGARPVGVVGGWIKEAVIHAFCANWETTRDPTWITV